MVPLLDERVELVTVVLTLDVVLVVVVKLIDVVVLAVLVVVTEELVVVNDAVLDDIVELVDVAVVPLSVVLVVVVGRQSCSRMKWVWGIFGSVTITSSTESVENN